MRFIKPKNKINLFIQYLCYYTVKSYIGSHTLNRNLVYIEHVDINIHQKISVEKNEQNLFR